LKDNILNRGTPKFALHVSLKIVSTSYWIVKISQKTWSANLASRISC